jgi:hypothetical protein
MKRLVRALFVLLIMLGVASQSIRASRGLAENDRAPFLTQRLADLGVRVTRLATRDVLMGQTPLCVRPMLIAPLTTSGAEDEVTGGLSKHEFMIRYIYLGEVEAQPSELWLTVRWAWASILFDAGLRPNPPPMHLVMVALPQSCPGLTSVDWSTLSR